jgi:uncharacterized protein (DUF58 family)
MTLALRFKLPRRGAIPAADDTGEVVLTQRRIYILPTRAGFLFGGTLVLMLLGCINYNLGLGFVLTFLVSGVGIVSMLHTFRNLARLHMSAGRATSVFTGADAVFPILLHGEGMLDRYAIGLRTGEQPLVFSDVSTAQTACAELRLPANERGLLALGRVRVITTFPLGLFRAWSNVDLGAHCMVFPKPELANVPLPVPHAGDSEGLQAGQGQEDFSGLRKYHAGDSLRHVAWKAVARGQPLMTKQFAGLAAGELWLDWDELPPELPVEARLSRLVRWALEAGSAGLAFGLRLPSRSIEPGQGPAHEERCLTALALFGK